MRRKSFVGYKSVIIIFLLFIISFISCVGSAASNNTGINIPVLDWIIENFVTIFILVTAVSICVIVFRIYRRYKKTGLGPRIISMFYIDGFNLKSIGNILCFVGIGIVVISLFYPWYEASGSTPLLSTDELNLITIDGINGVQINFPEINGMIPQMTPQFSLPIPFSLIIGIGLLFLVLATVGISTSRKLSLKYIGRGIRFLIPVIIIIVGVFMLASIGSHIGLDSNEEIAEVISAVSAKPFGGESTFIIQVDPIEVPVTLTWGLSLGGLLLLFGGVLMIVSGILEFIANTSFFEGKLVEKHSIQDPTVVQQQPPVQPQQPPQQPMQNPPKDTAKGSFCPECGVAVGENEKFCGKCGSKI